MENTSDALHIEQYPTQKHYISTTVVCNKYYQWLI